MAEPIRTAKRRRWPKILAGILFILIIPLVVGYFIATSESFFKRVILPKVSDSANADITVGSASISPFSKVVLRDLKVHPRGAEPLMTAQEVRLRYSLWAIIRGNIKVDEVLLAASTIEVITHPDGTSNLDPILKATEKDKKDREPSKEPSEPPKVDLQSLSLVNATVRHINQHGSGKPDVTELSGINLKVENVRNGESGKITMSSAIKVENTNGVLEAKAGGDFTFALSQNLKPASIKGESRFEVQNVSGAYAEASGLSSTIVADATPTEVRRLGMKFLKNNNALGEITAAGPFELAKTEGRLNVQISSIDRQVLNLVGGAMGLDFGKTVINSSNQVELARAGKVVSVNGVFNVAQFSVQNTNAATPPVDVTANYNVSVDTEGQVAKVQGLAVNGVQSGKPFLHLDTPSPMTITWGDVVVPTGDSALNLAVTEFSLTEWTPFLATMDSPVKSGVVNLIARITSQESGKQLRMDVTSRVENASAMINTNLVSELSMVANVRAMLTDLNRMKLSQLLVQAAHKGEPVATIKGNGQYDGQSLTTDMYVSLEADLPRALQMLPQPDLKATSGSFTFNGRVVGGQQSQTMTGTVALANFTGQLSENTFDNYGVAANLDIRTTGGATEIRQIAGSITEGTQPGGAFSLSGTYQTNGLAELAIKLNGLNENALDPFLAPMLDQKKLVSVSLNGTADFGYNPTGASRVKSDIQVSKLVVSDPEKKIPATPLEAHVQLDGAMDQQVLDIRQARLGLTPTQRATNEISLTGRLDMRQTNALEGAIKIQADSLDLTAYYDIFSGEGGATNQAATPGTPSASAAPVTANVPPQEPEPVQLPVRKLSLEMNIGRLFLRELEIANLRASPQIEGSRVRTGPIEVTVNGAPIQSMADVNLGVTGYQYAVSTTIDKLPIEPFVNTFTPEQRGKMKGDVSISANVNGIGTTGANLKKHLDGQVRLDLTNGDVRIDTVKIVSNVIVFVAKRFNVPELLDSPVQQSHVEMKMGGGQIQVSPASFISALFTMNTGGAIEIANVLTNSPIKSWPVDLYLVRSVARKVPREILVSDQTNEWVKVANFIRVSGTVGVPKADVDEKGIAAAAVQQIGRRVGDETAQKALQALGGLLGGQKGTNAPSGTNSPSTNRPAPFNPLDLLKPKK